MEFFPFPISDERRRLSPVRVVLERGAYSPLLPTPRKSLEVQIKGVRTAVVSGKFGRTPFAATENNGSHLPSPLPQLTSMAARVELT